MVENARFRGVFINKIARVGVIITIGREKMCEKSIRTKANRGHK